MSSLERDASVHSVRALTARTHLDVHLERLRWMLQRYMRRFAPRFLQTAGALSDLCVGAHEIADFFGAGPAPEIDAWLERFGVAPRDVIDERLDTLDAAILARLRASDLAGGLAALPLEELRAGFMLDERELDLVIAAIAPRISTRFARIYAAAWCDFSVRQPTAGFLAELVGRDEDEADALMALMADSGRLVRFRLLSPGQSELWGPHTPRRHAPMAVPQRVVDFVLGTLRDEAMLAGCELFEASLDDDELVLDAEARRRLTASLRGRRPRIALVGPEGSGRRTVAQSLAQRAGQRLLEVGVEEALDGVRSTRVALDALADLLREARLHRAALLLRLDGLSDDTSRLLSARRQTVRGLLEEFPAPIFIATHRDGAPVKPLFGEVQEVTLTPPSRADQRVLWQRMLAPHLPDDRVAAIAFELGETYRLTPGAIARVTDATLERHAARGQTGTDELHAGSFVPAIQSQLDHRLGWLADVIAVHATLDDIVLPEDRLEQVREIMIYARHAEAVFDGWGLGKGSADGRGLSVLFSGAPGTGKTFLAGVLARELGRVLYRIDLSRVVDKYIGETEKNLARIFTEAERAQAVLLFDEADSLFATRTKVKSSNDRYANLEVNYLLQKLDTYPGVSILTTNFATSMDEAFMRRLRFRLEFPIPDAASRARLWRKLVPAGAPVEDDLDWQALGEDHEMSGGHIRNAVVRAAVMAMESGSSITYDLLQDSALNEARKMGVLIRDQPRWLVHDDDHDDAAHRAGD